jgi:Tfp pilus assembly protein PilF
VSLLLDALKRAEQEKLAKQGGARPEDAHRRESDVPAAPAAATPPPAGATPAKTPAYELQPMATSPSGAPPAAANSPRSSDAKAAQNVFNAKEAALGPDNGSKKGILIWSGLVIVVIVIAAFGAYVWYQMQTFAPRSLAAPHARPGPLVPVVPPSAPTAPAPSATPGPANGTNGSTVTVENFAPTQQPTSAIQPAPGTASASAPVEEPRKSASSGDRVQDAMATLLREPANSASASAPVRLAPSRDTPRVVPEVARGYRQLAEGDLAGARSSYGAALVADPTNLDALLGMATIEAHGGNRYAAASYYSKALAVDPRNTTAQAGLAAIEQDVNPDGLESRLRADLAQAPQSAALRFALGNLYANQSRWSEAQVEYFEAFRLDPANADVAYNLAVSLDHLKQPRLAAEYYARAIEFARGHATQFDPAAAARRLAQLKG